MERAFVECGEQLFNRPAALAGPEDDPYPVKKPARRWSARALLLKKLTINELGGRYPQIGLENIAWAMFEPGSGILSAQKAVQAVVGVAIKKGAEFLQDALAAPDENGNLDHLTTENGRRISAVATSLPVDRGCRNFFRTC
jgi:glycine/D-amino acid oxidase-like deaminating enzyme